MLAERLLETSISLQPHVVATVVEDGAVLLDLESKYFYHANRTAWAIMQLFETEGASLETIENACRSWGAPESDLRSVRAMLAMLRENELVAPAPAGSCAPPALSGTWIAPVVERQAEPLHTLVTNAFDPSIPLAE